VVATEVRALAQRSAAAAKEIKALISTSGSQVASGVQLVGQTGQALERILINIGEINTLVAEFAGAAAEQAGSLHEVNSAVDQMDHGTQQNASMVEENTAASFALASEAKQLATLIDRFEIGVMTEPSSRRRPAPLAEAPRLTPEARAVAGGRVAPQAGGDWQEF
jgi:methyl-accepting chemotaxis protein